MLLHLFTLAVWMPMLQVGPLPTTQQTEVQAKVSELETRMQSGEPADFADSSRELMKIARELNEGDDVIEASRLALNIFLSSAPADARRSAYAIISQRLPQEVGKHTTKVRMLGPHTTCWSRFQEAFEERLLPKQAWILSVKVRNTHQRKRQDALGTVAEIEFAIGNQHTTEELVQALAASGFDVKGWTVFMEVPAASLLTQ